MEMWETLTEWYAQFYGVISQNMYLEGFVTFLFFIIVAWIAVNVVLRSMMNIAKKTKTEVDDRVLIGVKKYIMPIIMLYGLQIALGPLDIPERISGLLTNGLLTIVVFLGAKIAMVVVDEVIAGWGKAWAKRTKSTVDDQLIALLYKIANILIIVFSILSVLNIWGIDITPMIAGLGVAGVAIAFAMQSTLGNLFGGISIIIDRSVKVGDVVELDANTVGRVLDVGLRSTRIRSFDNEVIIVPNGKLADMRITNYAHPDDSARLVIKFGVAYGSKIEKVKDVVMEVIKKEKGVLKDPKPMIRFLEMGDSSLNFKAYIWMADYSERFAMKDKLNTGIYNALNKAKISIPFPQMDVHLKK